MSKLQKFALAYLLALAMLIWGYQIGRYEAFPYAVIAEVSAFVSGHPLGTDTTVMEKLAGNAGWAPVNFMWPYPETLPEAATEVAVPGLRSRRERPQMFMASDAREGFRALFGAMDFEEAFWGGLLFGPDGELLHQWRLSTEHLSANTEEDNRKNMSGVHLFPDGSVIFNLQEAGGGVVKVDGCSNILWNIEGQYHHSITPTDYGTFWTYEGGQEDFDHVLVEASVATGEVIRRIDMAAVRRRNPYLHIFDLQREENVADTSHGNDIDPLPQALADDFPAFAPGSLLLSYRTQNLVFILNPETLSVDWWRIGAWDRQHDPDWEQGGKISIFSNNQRSPRSVSDIVGIDPLSYESYLLVDGSQFNFYSSINGNQQLTPFASRMVVSSTQGWIFEVDSDNRIIFSFLNLYNKQDRKALHVSNAMRVRQNYFETEFWKSCEQ